MSHHEISIMDYRVVTALWTTLNFSFNGENYRSAESSKYRHRGTLGLANFQNNALTTGCDDSSSCFVKTELFDMETLTWFDGPDYPFGE